MVAVGSGCVTARPRDLGVSIYSPGPDPMIAHDAAIADIYSDAKRRATQSLLTTFNVRAVADSSLRPAAALALFSLDARSYRQSFVTNYPSDDTGVNADFGSSLAAAHLFGDGTLHPINLMAKFALHDRDARARLLYALVVSRGTLQRDYALAAGHALRTIPAGDALATLAELPPPIRIAALSEVDWCGRRPSALLDRADHDEIRTGIAQAVSHCPRDPPKSRRNRTKPADIAPAH